MKTFPKLALSQGQTGAQVTVKFKGESSKDTKYVAWLDGLEVKYSDIDSSGKTTVPDKLDGTVYAAVVSSKETPSDDNMLSGFAITQLPFNSAARFDV